MESEPEAEQAEGEKPPSISVVDVKVASELVPRWSSLVIEVGKERGDEVLIGHMPDGLVVRIKLHPSKKEALVEALSRRWESFNQENDEESDG